MKRLRAWLWPAPDDALLTVVLLLELAAFVAALAGLAAVLVEVRRLRLGLGVAAGVGLAAVGAPLLCALGLLVSEKSEGARRLLRWTLPVAAVALVWLADAAVGATPAGKARKVLGYGVVGALGMTWIWLTLGRPDLRATFGKKPVGEVLDPGVRAFLGYYALFVVTTAGAGLAIATGPLGGGLLSRKLAEGGHVAGALLSGFVATVGVALARRLWRGPEADPDLVTPDAWARIVAQKERGAPAILEDLVKDGVPPPGRRWTLEVVLAVLRADDPELARSDSGEDEAEERVS